MSRAALVLIVPALAAGASLLPTGSASATAGTRVGSLSGGKPLYWHGVQVSNERVDDASLCGVEGACFDYKVLVKSRHAAVLRTSLRTADDSNGWEVLLIDPSGWQVADGTTYTLHGVAEDFDVDVVTHHPAPGLWTIRVVPNNVKDGTFQMRAAVDPRVVWPRTNPALRTHHGVYDVPPDLAADAPWHLTFEQPTPMVVVESENFLAIDGFHNTSASVADQPVYDCLPEQTVQQGAHHCLRFTSGFASLGPGKFEVYGTSSTPVAVNGGPLYQNVYRSDGSHYSRRAGFFTFHQIHAHYHVLGIARFQIYPVLRHGRLGPPGKVLKEGFCLGDIKMYNWYSWGQSEASPSSPDNCEPAPQPDGVRFYEGIDAGWEDSYKWQTSGQFVNFGNGPDGLSLLRVTVNPFRYLVEADSGHDTNDVAYTYFKVTGNDIHVIERGHGTSAWDPHKQVENPVFGER
jgi:hypothetical protein